MATSLVHRDSTPCIKSNLDLFTVPPTETSTLDSRWVKYETSSALSNQDVISPIEFTISPSENYLDLSQSFLYLRVKITKSDGTDLDAAATVHPVNYFMHSLIQQCD